MFDKNLISCKKIPLMKATKILVSVFLLLAFTSSQACWVQKFGHCQGDAFTPINMYPGCNDILNGTSYYIDGMNFTDYAFSLTTANSGWNDQSEFPTQSGQIVCWSASDIKYWAHKSDCSGMWDTDLGPANSYANTTIYNAP